MKSFLSFVIILFIFVSGIIIAKEHPARSVKTKVNHQTPAPKKVGMAKTKPTVTAKEKAKKHTGKEVPHINVARLMQTSSSAGLKPKALKAALNAYTWASDHGKVGSNKEILTVVDFSLPSYEKRMWVLDLPENKVLMKLYTTQGSASGDIYATRFSNRPGSRETSIGLYVTSEEYSGKHGVSMRLNGLQQGINSNARERAIVIHSAGYAAPTFIQAYHQAGHSWGCFGIAPRSKATLLNYIKGGSVFFAYAKPIERTSIVSNGPLSV